MRFRTIHITLTYLSTFNGLSALALDLKPPHSSRKNNLERRQFRPPRLSTPDEVPAPASKPPKDPPVDFDFEDEDDFAEIPSSPQEESTSAAELLHPKSTSNAKPEDTPLAERVQAAAGSSETSSQNLASRKVSTAGLVVVIAVGAAMI